MTSYILDATTTSPLSKNKPRQAVILCHGYGGDGKDISSLAINWQRFLPNTIFLCPNAPEVCAVNPQGYQWFDLTSEKEEIILANSLPFLLIKTVVGTPLNLNTFTKFKLRSKKISNF